MWGAHTHVRDIAEVTATDHVETVRIRAIRRAGYRERSEAMPSTAKDLSFPHHATRTPLHHLPVILSTAKDLLLEVVADFGLFASISLSDSNPGVLTLLSFTGSQTKLPLRQFQIK